MSNTLRFWLNDVLVEDESVPPTTTLLYYVRQRRHLTGTKEGCNEGDCGACTVVVADPAAPGGPTFRAINSCLVLLPMVQGKRVYTAEGLMREGRAHPVQQALVEELGSQCGYCTPGVIMSMVEAAYRADLDEPWKLDDQMCGNLCRCTGYRPIMDAVRRVAAARPDDHLAEGLAAAAREPGSMALSYRHGAQRFFTPSTLAELFEVLAQNPDARVVNGGTDLSLEITKQFKEPPCLVSLEAIAGLDRLEVLEDGTLSIGTSVRLSVLEAACRERFEPIERMLRFFGARQIKNRATVGGNLCTASPIGDMAPVLVALGASVRLESARGTRRLALEDFVTGYHSTALEPGEILASVEVPPLGERVRAVAYKVSKRQELDISTVAAGLLVELAEDGTVARARFAFGGMAARPGARAQGAEAAVLGKPWNEATADQAARAIASDFAPIDDHRGSGWYRATVAANLVRGFELETRAEPCPRLPYRPTATVCLETEAEVMPS